MRSLASIVYKIFKHSQFLIQSIIKMTEIGRFWSEHQKTSCKYSYSVHYQYWGICWMQCLALWPEMFSRLLTARLAPLPDLLPSSFHKCIEIVMDAGFTTRRWILMFASGPQTLLNKTRCVWKSTLVSWRDRLYALTEVTCAMECKRSFSQNSTSESVCYATVSTGSLQRSLLTSRFHPWWIHTKQSGLLLQGQEWLDILYITAHTLYKYLNCLGMVVWI